LAGADELRLAGFQLGDAGALLDQLRGEALLGAVGNVSERAQLKRPRSRLDGGIAALR